MKILIILIIIGIFFIYGILVGSRHIFPYKQLIYFKNLILNKNGGGTHWKLKYFQHYYNRKTQFEFLDKNNTYKVVMLGDSITEHGNWNELLTNCNIVNRGISGDTSDGLLDRINLTNSDCKMAFIMIGINDFSKYRSVNFVFNNYKKIIQFLLKRNIKVYVQSTLFTGVLRAKIHNEKVKQLNQKLKEYCKKNNIEFIDLNLIFTRNNLLLDKYSYDGLHLNGNTYKKWSKIIKEKLNE